MSGACAVAADERLAAYDFGPGHPFQAGRLDAGLSLLRAAGVLDDADLLGFGPAADADLELVHDRAYLAALARFSADPAPADPAEAARFGLVGDNRPFPGMEAAARLVTGATMASLDAVAAGDLAHVFAPVAGLHHAQRDRAVGFCLVNDVAVAVARCTRAWPLRVLYVDLDAHHGDGVQAAFYDDPRVCTVSLHETGRYLFPGSGEVHELGRPPGTGRSVNVPLEPRTGDDGVLAAFDAVVEPLAAAFRPDLLVTQNGCDGHADDPLSDLTMSLRGFRELARRLHRLAHRHCQGRWVATGGGGYDLDRVVPRAWALLWSELSGRRLPSRVTSGWLRRRPGAGGGARELEERNQRTVRAVRRLVLPPSVRVVYPLARRRPGVSGRLPGWEPRAGEHPAPRGPLVLRDRCPASLLRRLEVDPGIHAFVRAPEQEREVLARIAEEPTGEVVVAHTPRGGGGRLRGRARPRAGDPLLQPARAARGGRGRGGQRLAARRGGRRPAPLRRRARPLRGPHPDRLRPGLALGPGAERPVGRRLPAGPAAGVRGRRVRVVPHRRARDRLPPGQPVRGPHRQPGPARPSGPVHQPPGPGGRRPW